MRHTERHQPNRYETQTEHKGIPPKPPRRSGVATAQMYPKPSKEQIVNAMKDMSKEELAYILAELKKMLTRRR